MDVVYLDFSKAFDVVNHAILLAKIRCLGFSDQLAKWIESFLCGRTLYVEVGGEAGSEAEVVSGVPQGSVLGPLLFLIYVNIIAKNSSVKWYAFADDFKLYISFPRLQNDHLPSQLLQSDLNNLSRVSESWNLKLNARKCAVIRFGGRSYTDDSRSGYYLSGTEIKLVHSHKDLGITVDRSLKFHGHVDILVNKASALANQLLRSTVNRSEEFMVTLFVSHIRPLLDYCSTVWNLGYIGDIKKLESVQRRWTKQVENLFDVNYQSRLRTLQLFSIEGRLLRADLIKIWKIFNDEEGLGLEVLFDRNTHSATRGHRFKIAVPVCRTDLKSRFFNARRVLVWNSLPGKIVEVDSVEKFKHSLDRYAPDLFYQTAT